MNANRYHAHRLKRIRPLLWMLVLVPVCLGGCKSQPANSTRLKTALTNTVVVMPPNSASITASTPISITVTNVPSGQATNHIEVTALINLTNLPGISLPCHYGTNLPCSCEEKPMLAGCKPWWCSILDIIDHHLKEILSFILSLIGFWGGKSIARREKDENGQLEPWQTRQVIALGVFLLFLLGLGVGIWKFTPGPVAASNGPGPAWDTGKLEQQINQLKTAIDHFQFTAPQPPAPAGFPAEITVSILTAAGALSLFFIRKILEDRSINIAIRAEITRLYEVICRHQEWRERCKEEKEKQRAAAAASGTEPEPSPDKPEPLIPFAYPVYTKHVENIGVLRRKIVAQAVTFYGWVDYLNRFQEIRKDYISNGTLAVFDQRYDGMLKKFKGTFKAAFGQDYEPFKPNKNNPPEI